MEEDSDHVCTESVIISLQANDPKKLEEQMAKKRAELQSYEKLLAKKKIEELREQTVVCMCVCVRVCVRVRLCVYVCV